MAKVTLEDDRVGIYLNPVDEVLALHGSLHLPYSHIKTVTHETVPFAWYRGFRVGTDIPGVKVAGSFYNGDGVFFYDFHDRERCLTFELDHEHYQRVVVQVNGDQDPAALAKEIRARLSGS
jgi:hypothetical protein